MLLTIELSLGTSWTDSRIKDSAFSLGPAWQELLARLICVLIGITVGFFFNIFPDVYSASTFVRKSAAFTFEKLEALCSTTGTHASLRLQSFEPASPEVFDNQNIEIFCILEKLKFARNIISELELEPSVCGNIPYSEFKLLLTELREACEITFYILRILDISATSESQVIEELGWNSGEMKFRFLTKVNVLALALLAGGPMSENSSVCLYECHRKLSLDTGAAYKLSQMLYGCIDRAELLTRSIVGTKK